MSMFPAWTVGENLKHTSRDFPGGAVVKNPPANAGDEFEPWSGKIPHATEKLSPCATTTQNKIEINDS